jgi:glutathione S-transferase
MVDGNRVVTETMAIAAWLETRDTARRISFAPGSPESDRLHQVQAFLNTGFTGAFSPYWVAFELPEPDPAYQAALRRLGRDLVNDRHRKLEAMLGDTRYLIGDRPTIADAVFIGVARWADFHEAIDPAKFPRIEGLKSRLNQDPAVRFAAAIEAGEIPTGSGALKGHVPLTEVLARQAA